MSEQIQVPIDTPTKKSWYKRWWGIALIALAALFVLTALFGSGTEETTASDTETQPTPTAEATQPAEPVQATEEPSEDAGIGVPVRDGKFEFTVEGVQTGVASVGNEFLNETAQGSFTLVTLKVTNIGDEPQMFFDSNVTGFDAQGREFSADSTAGLCANPDGEGFINDVNPGNSVTALVVFDVPVGESLTSIEVKDSAFSGGGDDQSGITIPEVLKVKARGVSGARSVNGRAPELCDALNT
jgi:hypothetical protein